MGQLVKFIGGPVHGANYQLAKPPPTITYALQKLKMVDQLAESETISYSWRKVGDSHLYLASTLVKYQIRTIVPKGFFIDHYVRKAESTITHSMVQDKMMPMFGPEVNWRWYNRKLRATEIEVLAFAEPFSLCETWLRYHKNRG